MNLREARKLAKLARKTGNFLKVTITENKTACDLHDITRHPWCGNYTVVAEGFGPHDVDHSASNGTEKLIWTRDDCLTSRQICLGDSLVL